MSRKTSTDIDSPFNDYDLGPVLISGVEPPLAGDTESDGALGARHVEHNLEVLLLRFPNNAVDTEIYLIWNNPEAPVDYLIVQPENLNNTFFSLMVDKEQILPEWAEVYCIIKRPSGNPSKTKPLKLRVKRSRPGDPDPNPEAEGNQGFVFNMDADIEAGSHVDMARAERGVWVEVEPWENQTAWDRCLTAWGTEIVEHVVLADEVRRPIKIFISPEVIKRNPHYADMPVAMQVKDVGGNLPADPNSKSNWSEIKRVNVDLGLLRPHQAFLEQGGEIIDIDKLGDAEQKVRVFTDNNFFEVGDRIHFEFEARDIQGVPFFHSDQKDVNLTNYIEDFFLPNELTRAAAGGIAIMYYQLYKHRDDEYLPSRKVRIRIVGNVIEWPAPCILEAPHGELSPTSTATIKFRAQAGWTSATKIRIVMAAHSVNYTYEFFMGPIPEDREYSHIVPNGEVGRFNTLPVEVYYERIDLLPHRQSQRLQIQVGEPAKTLPQVEVEHVRGNYLDPDDVGLHIRVTLPISDSRERDTIKLRWDGDFASTEIEVILSEDQAGKALEINIERRFVSENLNGSVKIRYDLARANSPKRYSEIRTLYIRPGFDHITDFKNNNLNGWAFGAALSDLRDRAFKNYGDYTTLYNLTYPPGSKNGSVFIQRFNNLQQDRQYEFSIKVRRVDGIHTIPLISINTEMGATALALFVTDTVNFHTLSGILTPDRAELTFDIHCHQSTSRGNDYEIREIRVRLI